MEREFRHALGLDGGVPAELKSLGAGQRAVVFGEDQEGQNIIYLDGVWYHAKRAEDGWRRLTGLRPLYLGCFAGTPDELAAALKRLLLGEDAVVRARKDGKDFFLRYSMKDPHRKVPVDGPAAAPSPADPPNVEEGRAAQRRAELVDLERRLREAQAAGGREARERIRELVREKGKRLQETPEKPGLLREREELDRKVDRLVEAFRRAEGEERERLLREIRRGLEEMVTIDALLKRREADELERNQKAVVEERLRRRVGGEK